MKSFAFLAFLALAAAFDVGSYQQKHIDIRDGSIFVIYQGWNIVLSRPIDHFDFLEVFVTGPNNFNRKVLIDNQFQVVRDYYLNNDYASTYQQYYDLYKHQFGQYFGQTNFNQFEYLLSIFRQYVGPLDVQHYGQLLNHLQTEVQQGKVHFLVFEFFKTFGVNEEFLYGKFSSQFYGPYQYQGQHYGKNSYGRDYFNKNFYGIDSYNKNYDFNGPYDQHYGQEVYGPYNQQYFGQEYSRPYSSQYYGPYSSQYYGPYSSQYYGQQYQKGQYFPYQQYHSQYYSYPEYQGSYYGQQYGQSYQQYPSFLNKLITAY